MLVTIDLDRFDDIDKLKSLIDYDYDYEEVPCEETTLESCFETLIKYHYINRKHALNRNYHVVVSRFKFAKEFQTIRLQVGRSVGHTTLAKQILNKSDGKHAYVCKNSNMFQDDINADQISLTTLNKFRGIAYDFVVIDDASTFQELHLDRVYEALLRSEETTFILLG